MFFEPSELSWVARLEQGFEPIQSELQQLEERQFGAYPGEDLYEQDWDLFPLFVPGKPYPKNMARCPRTTELVKSIPGVTLAMFSRLGPGCHVKPHKGHSKVVLRYHLGLTVPPEARDPDVCGLRVGDTVCSWQPGKSLVFDDIYEHEAWNRTDQTRTVLMVDFLRPFRYRTSWLGMIRQRLFARSEAFRRKYADRIQNLPAWME
jgi:beta-hydroxylase